MWLGASTHGKKRNTYMIRRRRRRSGCSILGDDHPNLLWRGVRSSAPRGGHRLRGRRRHLRLPYHLLSGIAKIALRGVATKENNSQRQESNKTKKDSKRHPNLLTSPCPSS